MCLVVSSVIFFCALTPDSCLNVLHPADMTVTSEKKLTRTATN
jgi:hypothetical protein